MKTDWEKAKKIFDEAHQLTPAERAVFLDEICAGDAEMRRAVESLLASSGDAESFSEARKDGNPADEPDETATRQLINDANEAHKASIKQLKDGAIFGHYEILKQIGTGGMGEVYLANDTRLERRVAVKILNEKYAENESNLKRFVLEAKAASALNHPNILVIHEIGETGDAHFIISEYVEGATLRDIFNGKPLALPEILDIAIQIASALCAAHAAGIVHRDIKPENIMMRPDNLVKILDFGLAKLVNQKQIGQEESTVKQNRTAKGLILGTINYMSPEQAKGERIDERTDIFSFGVVLYEMITGQTPFAGDSMPEALANLMNKKPLPLSRFAADAPPELERIIVKTLRKNKDERYQTMKGLLADLKELKETLAFDEKLENAPPDDKETNGLLTETGNINKQTALAAPAFFQPIKRKPVVAAAILALLIAAAGLGYWFFANRAANVRQFESIAVMPFANESGNADAEYLSDGMTETLIGSLSQLPNLSVKARSSVFRYKGKEINLTTFGKELNVQAILTGRVVQRGDDLMISLSLDDVANENNIWSKQYDRKMTNLVGLQAEIARDVADHLKSKLSGADKQKLAKNYTANAEAYQLYLRGRYHLLKTTLSGFQAAIPYFRQAIDIDPNYALAYAGLADAYRSMALGGELLSGEVMPQAKAAASKALEIDDSLADAHAILGFIILWYDWDWNAAENQLKRALEIDPDNSDAHLFYAYLLSRTGRHTEALAEARRARELDPLNLRTNSFEAQIMNYAGRNDEALARLQEALKLDPNHWLLYQGMIHAYIEKGMYAEAIAAARKSLENNFNTRTIAYLAYALAKSGKTAEANAELAKLLKLSQERYVPPYNIAMIYNGLGNRDETFKWLESAVEKRDPRVTFLKVEQKWNNLHGDPRFQDLMRQIGFPQ